MKDKCFPKDKIKVIITSSGNKIGIIKCLQNVIVGEERIIVTGCDVDENCLSKYFLDKFFHLPKLGNHFLVKLIEVCRSNGITHIIPTRDEELCFFYKNAPYFEELKIKLMVCLNPERFTDKLLFYNKFKSRLPIIQTSLNPNLIESSTVVVKEKRGSGSKNIRLNIPKETANREGKNFESPIFQPFIAGDEYSLDAYKNSAGETLGMVIRKRITVVNGEAKVTQNLHGSHKLYGIMSNLLKQLDISYHFNLQFITRKNEIFIIECNARFGGASKLSVELGLSSFKWFLFNTEHISEVFKPSRILTQIKFESELYI